MDNTERQITKIAREANRFTVQTMKEDGIGTAEMDVIHFVRHNPGTTQKEMWEALKIDKGATARRVARLEEKGCVAREKQGRGYRYLAVLAREEYLPAETKSLLGRLFGGRPRNFVAALAETDALTEQDIDELAAYLEELKKQRG